MQKMTCTMCNGKGEIPLIEGMEYPNRVCPSCKGSGVFEIEDKQDDKKPEEEKR